MNEGKDRYANAQSVEKSPTAVGGRTIQGDKSSTSMTRVEFSSVMAPLNLQSELTVQVETPFTIL